ncbi:hypothetical protein [Pseudothauera hydrothermalis]|uniref:hypothetical protein n=1 Tax=Pseudothauera hydrothermalis TaxID=2184083 RepID=UPI0013C35E14|nr:hypothetical protein [Pseudothauera hydrothermalis]
MCHAETALEAWAEEAAARELFGLLATLPDGLSRALVRYLGLFRSAKRALAWDRALRLAREVLALGIEASALEAALAETVEAMLAKREAGDVQPLQNHNYLKRVAESVAARQAGAPVAVEATRAREASAVSAKPSATVDGVMRLEALKRRARGAA